MLNCEHITDFPGFSQGVAGYTGSAAPGAATAAGLQIAMNEVTAVRRDGDLLRIETDGGAHTTRTLIVASGSRFTALGVPGEEEFVGRGLSHSPPATAPLHGEAGDRGGRRRRGGGRGDPSHPVRLLGHRAAPPRDPAGCASLQERGRSERKLSFRWNTALRAIEGADGVERVQVEDLATGKTDAVPASGVFIYAGLTPKTEFWAASCRSTRAGRS